MVALILYAFATNVRSSRGIECHCRQDVAYRVITGQSGADHATIARFIDRHQRALAGCSREVLKLCEQAGLVESGVVSIDGTRIAGNASPEVNLHLRADRDGDHRADGPPTDEAEDEELGEARGDELPRSCARPEGRREFFCRVRQQLQRGGRALGAGRRERDGGARGGAARARRGARSSGAAGRGAMRGCGRASVSSSSIAGMSPDPVSRSREERLLLAAERLEEELSARAPRQ